MYISNLGLLIGGYSRDSSITNIGIDFR